MTKAEIIAEISSKTGIEKVDVQETVEAFFKVVKSSMVNGENVYVRGFGSFVVKKKSEKNSAKYFQKHSYNNSGTLCSQL
jgi:DNA-binding protein HU-beta